MAFNFQERLFRYRDPFLPFVVILAALCAFFLEGTIAARIAFVSGFLAFVILPGWCLATLLAPTAQPVAKTAYALLLGLVVPPFILLVGNFLFSLPISLVSLSVVSAVIVLLFLIFRSAIHDKLSH